MYKIENAQKVLCEYLIDMMPVEWQKICYYSRCTMESCSPWFALIEKNTGAICTQESFWKRYAAYPCKEMEAYGNLVDLTRNLFNAYLEKFGKNKIWCTYFLTIEEDYTFHADFGYEKPEGNIVEQHDAVFRKFFHTAYTYLDEKYPY